MRDTKRPYYWQVFTECAYDMTLLDMIKRITDSNSNTRGQERSRVVVSAAEVTRVTTGKDRFSGGTVVVSTSALQGHGIDTRNNYYDFRKSTLLAPPLLPYAGHLDARGDALRRMLCLRNTSMTTYMPRKA